MSGLIDHISKNSSLLFMDAETKEQKKFSDLNLFDELLVSPQKELIFLYTDNSLSGITAFFSCWKSSHAIALLPPSLNTELKQALENTYQPGWIIENKNSERQGYKPQQTVDGYHILRADKINGNKIHPDLKLLLSTSGTTGSPRFVKLTETNLVENALSILDYLPVNANDVCPLNLPVYYSYGLSILTTNCIKGGTVLCSNRDIMMAEFWKDFESYTCTSLAGVPFVYEILNRTGFTKKSFPALRYLTQAGGKLNAKMVDVFSTWCNANGVQFYVMYGQTEATARMSWLPPDKTNSKTESIGIAIKNGTFKIDSATHELLYKGPNVFYGYLQEPAGLAEMEQPEWLHTGDQARADNEGFYYITGRLKRMVKLFGNRINLDETETLLKNHFGQSGLVCCGLNDKHLLVFETTTPPVGKDAISNYLFHTLGLHPSAIKHYSITELPLTQNGKPDYNRLLADYGNK